MSAHSAARMAVRWRRVVVAGEMRAVVVSGGSASATPPASDHRSTATVLQHGLGVSATPGLVREGNRVTVSRSGVADLNTGTSMPVDGYFRIGSTTKTFASVGGEASC